MPIAIPERHKEGLKAISRLPADKLAELAQELKRVSITASAEINATIPEIQRPMIRALRSLYLGRAQAEVSLDRFLDDLATELSKDIPDSYTEVRGIFEKLVSMDDLMVRAKAASLKSEYSDIYCSSRVLTDIRPVWPEDGGLDCPSTAIVSHVLKLEYHHGDRQEHRELYLALDKQDISSMIDVLRRAQSKEASLEPLMKRAEVSNITN